MTVLRLQILLYLLMITPETLKIPSLMLIYSQEVLEAGTILYEISVNSV